MRAKGKGDAIQKEKYLPSKLILATLVYRLSPAFSVIGLNSTVTASFDGVGLTLYNTKHIKNINIKIYF